MSGYGPIAYSFNGKKRHSNRGFVSWALLWLGLAAAVAAAFAWFSFAP